MGRSRDSPLASRLAQGPRQHVVGKRSPCAFIAEARGASLRSRCPRAQHFIILLWSSLAWKPVCRPEWEQPAAPQLDDAGQPRAAAGLEAGGPATVPGSGKVLLCPRRGHSRVRASLGLAGARCLRTCWSVRTDALAGKKPWIGGWRGLGGPGQTGRRARVEGRPPSSSSFTPLPCALLLALRVSARHTGQLPQTCPPRPHLANPPRLLPGQRLCKEAPHVSWHQRDGQGGSGPGMPGPGALMSGAAGVELGPWPCGGTESAL